MRWRTADDLGLDAVRWLDAEVVRREMGICMDTNEAEQAMTTPPNEQPQDARPTMQDVAAAIGAIHAGHYERAAALLAPCVARDAARLRNLQKLLNEPGAAEEDEEVERNAARYLILRADMTGENPPCKFNGNAYRDPKDLDAALDAERTNAPPSNARPEPTLPNEPERNGRPESVGAPQERAGEWCIAIIRKYLLHDSQRAVSWHEVQDCIEAIRSNVACGETRRAGVAITGGCEKAALDSRNQHLSPPPAQQAPHTAEDKTR